MKELLYNLNKTFVSLQNTNELFSNEDKVRK